MRDTPLSAFYEALKHEGDRLYGETYALVQPFSRGDRALMEDKTYTILEFLSTFGR